MNIKRKLTSILTGALILVSVGCNKNYSIYQYDGKIKGEHVKFESNSRWYRTGNILTVTKSDGKIIKYHDVTGNDLKLDVVEKINRGITNRDSIYSGDETNKHVLDEAQKQFDNYLEEILKIKTNREMDNLLK